MEAPPSPPVDLPLESAVISSPEHVIVMFKIRIELMVELRVKLRVINHHPNRRVKENQLEFSFWVPISTQAEKEPVQMCFCYLFSVI